MKKLKKLILCFLFIPILALTACVAPPSYLITVSRHGSWGIIVGAPNGEMEEGSKAVISVEEADSQNHPFICWIKDYKKVYSTEKQIELVYGEETQGHYTAVFDEDSENMLFSTISAVDIQDSTSYSQIEYTILYSSNTSGSNNYFKLTSATIDATSSITPFQTDNLSVLYYGPLGASVEYKFKMNITCVDLEGNSAYYETSFPQIVNNQTTSISTNISDTNIIVSLKFDKISYSMYHADEQQ